MRKNLFNIGNDFMCICYIVMVYLFLKNLGSKGTFLIEYPILKELVYIVIPVIHVYIFFKNKKR